MTVECTKTHSDFKKDQEYELILEHPSHYAIFDTKGQYTLVKKNKFKLKEKKGSH